MSRILFLSDLHFCDYRNSVAYEARRNRRLAEFIRGGHFDLVVNLGDTVSRSGVLRADLEPHRRELFDGYLAWRAPLGVPFLECALAREKDFFQDLYGQPMDYAYQGIPGFTAIAFDPAGGDLRGTAEQWHWLEERLAASEGTPVLINTHVPYPGNCSRPIKPGTYIDVPEAVQRRVENFPSRVFWASGHFHWELEEPVVKGSLTAFMGACFRFETESADYDSYLRILNTETLELETVVNPV